MSDEYLVAAGTPRLLVLGKYDQEEKSKGGIDGVAATLSSGKSLLRMILEPDAKSNTRVI